MESTVENYIENARKRIFATPTYLSLHIERVNSRVFKTFSPSTCWKVLRASALELQCSGVFLPHPLIRFFPATQEFRNTVNKEIKKESVAVLEWTGPDGVRRTAFSQLLRLVTEYSMLIPIFHTSPAQGPSPCREHTRTASRDLRRARWCCRPGDTACTHRCR